MKHGDGLEQHLHQLGQELGILTCSGKMNLQSLIIQFYYDYHFVPNSWYYPCGVLFNTGIQQSQRPLNIPGGHTDQHYRAVPG